MGFSHSEVLRIVHLALHLEVFKTKTNNITSKTSAPEFIIHLRVKHPHPNEVCFANN